MSDDPAIRIDEQGVMIKLSGDKEVARRQWEKARKLINMHLAIDEEEAKPDAQQSTAPKKKKKKAWSDEEEDIIANNLDKKPAELKNLLNLYGYERSYGAVDQKQRQILEQQREQEDEEEDYKRGSWADWEEEHLINEYHNKKLSEIATDLNRPYGTVYQRKDKLVSEGRLLTPKEKQKSPDDIINEIKQEAEGEEETKSPVDSKGEEGDNEGEDSAFPKTLVQYLWRNTSWKRVESKEERVEGIQKLMKDRYGMDITKEQVEEFIAEDEGE